MPTEFTTKLTPVLYNPSYEIPEEGESESTFELLKTMAEIRNTTYKDSGHAMRSVHVKSHGLLKGEMEIIKTLSPFMAQGMFSKPATYPLFMRLSASPGDQLPDSVSTPRGCVIKIVGVEGDRLPGTEGDTTQDFIGVNAGPTFMVDKLKKFVAPLKMFAAGTDQATNAKVVISSLLQGVEKAIESVGGSSGAIRGMGGEPQTHILGETFYTQAPILFGNYMAKLCIAPVSESLTALKGVKIDAGDDPNALRTAVSEFFATQTGVWELRAQLCTDIEKMPIEDTSVEWPEEMSPYVAVANITIKPQTSWSEARSKVMDDGMSFSPWHGLAAHRPLGAIMRARRAAYKESAAFRAEINGKVMEEPKSTDVLLY